MYFILCHSTIKKKVYQQKKPLWKRWLFKI